jgi:hypothetical protein
MIGATDGLSGSRLAERYGVQPAQVEALRRAGELLGVRNGRDHHYPAWQLNGGGKALPEVRALIAAARTNGVSDDELVALLTRRVGMSRTRVIDLVRRGDTDLAHRLVRANAKSSG